MCLSGCITPVNVNHFSHLFAVKESIMWALHLFESTRNPDTSLSILDFVWIIGQLHWWPFKEINPKCWKVVSTNNQTSEFHSQAVRVVHKLSSLSHWIPQSATTLCLCCWKLSISILHTILRLSSAKLMLLGDSESITRRQTWGLKEFLLTLCHRKLQQSAISETNVHCNHQRGTKRTHKWPKSQSRHCTVLNLTIDQKVSKYKNSTKCKSRPNSKNSKSRLSRSWWGSWSKLRRWFQITKSNSTSYGVLFSLANSLQTSKMICFSDIVIVRIEWANEFRSECLSLLDHETKMQQHLRDLQYTLCCDTVGDDEWETQTSVLNCVTRK